MEGMLVGKSNLSEIDVSKIRMDGGTQPREVIDQDVVSEYAERIEAGDEFPPVVAFYDGTDYWLADGFHRMHAYQQCDYRHVDVDVRQGTRRDAQWFSFGANKSHGKRRAPGDIRRAVIAILGDGEWKKEPQTKIAAHVGISQGYVSQIVSSLPGTSYNSNKMRVVERNGGRYEQNTANIGRSRQAETTVEVVDTGTGEVIEDAEIVRTTVTRTEQKSPRGTFDAAAQMMEVLRSIQEQMGEIAKLTPKRSMATEVLELARAVIKTTEKLIARIEKGN
jgi:hypothetical protein